MKARWKPRTTILLGASAIFPVAVAVAGNQILNDGVWSVEWMGVAAVLAGAGTLLTYRLTGSPTVVETSPPPRTGTPTEVIEPVDPPVEKAAEQAVREPEPVRRYGGDHIEFHGNTVHGPITGKQVRHIHVSRDLNAQGDGDDD